MDYLRSLGSVAVSSLVQKSGLNLPFIMGSKVSTLNTNYSLYDGTKRDDGSNVSIFEYDLTDPSAKKLTPLAQNSFRKLRSTRHPDVLKFVDAVENETTIYLVTERVRPLSSALKSWASKGNKEKKDWFIWGLHRISVALAFINEECSSTHGNLHTESIFISPSGEWKLGGFEILSSPKDDNAVLYTLGASLPGASSRSPPEVKKSGWSVLREQSTAAADAHAFGLLIHSLFNPTHPPPPAAQPPYPPPQPSTRGSIPTELFSIFKKLLNPNPRARLSIKAVLDIGMGKSPGEGTAFFANNQLVQVCAGLDNFNLESEVEKASFLRVLKESASSFPPEFSSFKILPSLIQALEFGGASAAAILPLVLQLGENISPEDYPSVVLAPLIKLFASPDRGIRLALLDDLSKYADVLDKKTVVDKIWPHLQTGFSDTVAIVRESTVKSITLLSTKLSDRLLNNDLLRHLAKLQTDPEASIRTNTCILIGRLGPSLGFNTKRKVLVPAFARALKDPFVHARIAGLKAFMATVDCFEMEELATRVIPNISALMVDKEKIVRDQAFKAVDMFVKKLEIYAAGLPETVNPTGIASANGTPVIPGQYALVNTAADAAGVFAGWAISSLSKTLGAPETQGTIDAAGIHRPTSAPTLEGSMPSAPPLSVTNSGTASLPRPTRSTGKGMQLGAHKVPTAVASVVLAEEMASQGSENPWGNDDLIDINADEDDWSAFETAPVTPIVAPKPVSLEFTSTPSQNEDSPATNEDKNPWQDISHEVHTPQAQARHIPEDFSKPLPSTRQDLSPPQEETKNDLSNVTGVAKEDKVAEMARRKEERKQRIAQLKEQKKNATLRHKT